jgi:membrane dipeptidase
LKAGYGQGDPKESVTTEHVVAHIDHICQCVGDADHVGIGSNFDGGFGVEDTPDGISEHSDLNLVTKALQGYGYDEEDIIKIMGGNWLSLLRYALNP